jgi:hypothetical protein
MEAGGKVISLEFIPENTENNFPDKAIHNRMKTIFGNSGNAVLIENWKGYQIEKTLNGFLQKVIELNNESLPLRFTHRYIKNKNVFFIYNNSEKPISTEISLNIEGPGEEWDPASGKITEISNQFRINLLPYHGKIYKTK